MSKRKRNINLDEFGILVRKLRRLIIENVTCEEEKSSEDIIEGIMKAFKRGSKEHKIKMLKKFHEQFYFNQEDYLKNVKLLVLGKLIEML
jgi:hypothetical protein